MDREVEQGDVEMSVDDIAATLLSASTTDDAVEASDDEAELSPGGGQEDSDTPEDSEQEEAASDEPAEALDDEADYLDIDDADLIELMVDNERQEVSIGDLKKAFSGEGAIEKRLHEATELRKTAHAERTQLMEQLAAQESALVAALDGMDDSVFTAVIPAPPESLRQSNPDQYLRHKEAYDQDQSRIASAKKAVEDTLAQVMEQRQTRLKEYAAEAGKVIASEIPELADPTTSKAMFTRLADTAKLYGYTDAEINSALDPRMFRLVRDAMLYRDLKSKTSGRDPLDTSKQEQKKVRRLRSGSTSANKVRARQNDQKRKQLVDKARQTGKVDDVAATLLR